MSVAQDLIIGGATGVLDEAAVRRFVAERLAAEDLDGRSVCVIVPDGTRSCPLPLLLGAVHEALDGRATNVTVLGEPVRIKVGHAGGVLVQVMPEFDDVAAVARRQRRPEREVLAAAAHAAAAAGLVVGGDR